MTNKISDLAGIDPSYAERLHNDHVLGPCCAEVERLLGVIQLQHGMIEILNKHHRHLAEEAICQVCGA